MTNKELTGQRIRQSCERLGIRQVDLVNKTGISKGMINCYTKGRATPSYEKAVLLAKTLGHDAFYFMGYNTDDIPPNDDMPQEVLDKLGEAYKRSVIEKASEVFDCIAINNNEIELIRRFRTVSPDCQKMILKLLEIEK